MLRDPGLVPLSHDHQHALALCVLTERALKTAPGEDAAARQAAKIVYAFDEEILGHFQFEEQILFPMLEPYEGMAALIGELKAEHAQMLERVEGLRRAGGREQILEFCAMLRAHVRKEESILFERAQELLPAERLQEIGEKRRDGQGPARCLTS